MIRDPAFNAHARQLPPPHIKRILQHIARAGEFSCDSVCGGDAEVATLLAVADTDPSVGPWDAIHAICDKLGTDIGVGDLGADFPLLPQCLAERHPELKPPPDGTPAGIHEWMTVELPSTFELTRLWGQAVRAVARQIIDDGDGSPEAFKLAAELTAPCGDQASAVNVAEPFPLDVLPEPLQEYTRISSGAFACPPQAMAMSLLTAAGGLIGARLGIDGVKPGWIESATLWTAIVAPSGWKKSPIWQQATKPITQLENRAAAEYECLRDGYKKLKADAKAAKTATMPVTNEATGETRRMSLAAQMAANSEPVKPTRKRYKVGNITLPKLHGLLAENRGGLIVLPDELGAWMSSHGRYSQTSEQVDWLPLYSNAQVVVDRKTKAKEDDEDSTNITLDRPAAAVLGGIPPSELARYMTGRERENGLLSRFILVDLRDGEDRRGTWDNFPEAVNAAVQQMFEKLVTIPIPPFGTDRDRWPCVPMCDDAEARWREYYEQQETLIRSMPEGLEPQLWSKLQGTTLRFALILHCLKLAAQDDDTPNWRTELSLETLEDAIELTQWAGNETLRVYHKCGILAHATAEETATTKLAEQAMRVLQKMETAGVREWTVRQVARSIHGCRTADALVVVQGLIDAGYAAWKQEGGIESKTTFVLIGQEQAG